MAQEVRPPVVTIMGHVDHGKTSLLDAIRHTSVAAKEAGSITQHIGAYQIEHAGKKITFIDTPGHAAFTKMRSRGAATTDIVVLVVSSTEGVKPQTAESISQIKAAGVQYLVALTKMDLPEANPEMVKAQLAEREVFVEGYGGDVVLVPVSAKTGDGLDKLLEMIQLIAELAELKADPAGALEGVVIESKKDMRRGEVATVLVRNGTLRVGDSIYADQTHAKVKAMNDAVGASVKEASLSMPVEVLGWDTVPTVGAKVSTEQHAVVLKEVVAAPKPETPKDGQTVPTQDAEIPLPKKDEHAPRLNLIVKSDAAGTLEAIEQSITGDEINMISKGIGDVTDTDVLLAEATKSLIVGMHVKVSSSVKKLAESVNVKIKTYTIIYELLENLQKQVLKLIEPTIDEEELGTAEIAAIFEMKGEKIAGCKIKTGEISRTALCHLKRADRIVADPKMKSMKTGKQDLESAKAGTECGIVFRNFTDFQVGDVLVAYRVKED